MTEAILRAAIALAGIGSIIEVRALTDNRIASGYFDSPEELAAKVEPIDILPTTHGIYITLNTVDPTLFARRTNRIKMRLDRNDATTADENIVSRRWLPIDLDPVRPSGISSTDEEHAFALAKSAAIAEWLAGLGYPEPLRADSGNGAHLLYRIDLPNDDSSTALVKSCLETLDLLFSDEQVRVDPANYNAARIWKLYGTISRKGDSTTERPYRRSALLSAPETFGIVSREQLETLVGQLPTESCTPQPAAAYENGFDLRSWLSEHGLTIRHEKPYNGGTLYVLDQCPFSTDHKDGAYAIQFGSGAVFAGCKHTSCGGGKQHWWELRDRLDPDFAAHHQARKPKPAALKQDPRTVEVPAQHPCIAPDPELQRRAQEIYKSGEFLAFTKEVFSRVWLGDQHILEAVLYCAANMSVENATDAVHIHVAGQTQSGKSDSVKTALKFVSAVNQMTKTFSPMYLFHASKTGALHEKMILFTDDTVFNPEIAALYRNVLTSWFTGVTRGTVIKQEPMDLNIPPRVSLIITNIENVVNESEDGQDESRFLTLEVRRTSADMKQIREFIQRARPNIQTDLELIQAIWDCIAPRTITLHTTLEKDLPIREFKRFLTLCQARALLCNRDTTTDEDIDAVEKFLTYSKPMINSTTPGFTRKEATVFGCLTGNWKTVNDIVKETGMTVSDVYRALRGRDGSFQQPRGGLMSKEPRLEHIEEHSDTENNIHLFRLIKVGE